MLVYLLLKIKTAEVSDKNLESFNNNSKTETIKSKIDNNFDCNNFSQGNDYKREKIINSLKIKRLQNKNNLKLHPDEHVPLKKQKRLKNYFVKAEENKKNESNFILNRPENDNCNVNDSLASNNLSEINKNENLIKNSESEKNVEKQLYEKTKTNVESNNINIFNAHLEKIITIQNNANNPNIYKESYKEIPKNIIIENINSFSTSKDFLELYYIIEKDLVHILKIATTYIYLDNKYFNEIILKYNNYKDYSYKIYNLLHIEKSLLKMEFKFTKNLNSYKLSILNRILDNTSIKDQSISILKNKNKTKISQMTVQIYKKEIQVYDILKYTIYHINALKKKFIQTLCILGFQNLFIYDLKNSMPRITSVLCILFKYIKENQFCSLQFQNNLIKLFSIMFLDNNDKHFFNQTFNKVFEKKDAYISFRLYLALNSESPDIVLNHYDKIQSNTLQFQFINQLIDSINKTKCKMFRIDLIP